MTMSDLRSCVTFSLVLLIIPLASFAQQQFFPSGVLGETPQLDKGTSKWYSSQLRALHEPSLWELSKTDNGQSYRFLWLRTWDHPLSVRIVINSNGTGRLVTKMSSGTGGYDPGKLILDHTRELTKEQVASLRLTIETAAFWGLPTNETTGGKDGARWIIEGVRQGQYHIADRWSPDSGPVRHVGLYLVHLPDLEIPAKKVY
jgi:hypothetical protein